MPDVNQFFEFNQFSAPLLIGFLQGIIFSVILFMRGWREERISDYLAAIILVLGSMYGAQWMFGFAGWYDSHDWRTTLMFYVEWKNLIAFGPLIWLYFRALTNTDFRWEKKYWWHFLPWGLLLLTPLGIFLYDVVYSRLMLGEPFAYFYNTRGPAAEWDNNGDSTIFYLIFALSCVHLVVYLLRTLREYRRYRAYIDREFSNASQLSFRSLRITLYLLLLGVTATVLFEIVNVFTSRSYVDSWDSYFSMSLLVYFAAIQFFSLTPQLTRALRFRPDQEEEPEAAEVALSGTGKSVSPDSEVDLSAWATKLDRRLEEHEDYLNPDLKLGDLADELGTNSSILSKVINSVHGVNFNDFINARRCEAFLRRIEAGDHERHTLLSIALDCGFNSKSTFNRAFKKQTGLSPGQAVRAVRQ
ncbi:AraC family transcriptional regulator [Lewinella sp. W8]|uniref:helix-turn-helix domain-containing protein n=1 Tax=Lewinella sp. W8 TaxID=2528208 RepID=UPI001067CCA3|nr:helix-turn-helix domain-containing protein [Lewinella sp. W8]